MLLSHDRADFGLRSLDHLCCECVCYVEPAQNGR